MADVKPALPGSPAYDAANQGPLIFRVNTAMVVLCTLATALRFWSRALVRAPKARLWWDDWTCMVSCILQVGLSGLLYRWIQLGMGRHITAIDPATVVDNIKCLYAALMLFHITVILPKFSALFFYWRVFGLQNKQWACALWCSFAFCASWVCYTIPIAIWNCVPIEKLWDRSLPGTCVNTFPWYVTTGVHDILLDLNVLILPMPLVWRLHVSTRKKLGIIGAFVCGYLCLVLSVGRFASVIVLGSDRLNALDFTWNDVQILLWANVETPFSIFSICLPAIFQLGRRLNHGGPRSLFTTKEPSNKSRARTTFSASEDERQADGFRRLREHDTASFSNASRSMVMMSMTPHGSSKTDNRNWVELSRMHLPPH